MPLSDYSGDQRFQKQDKSSASGECCSLELARDHLILWENVCPWERCQLVDLLMKELASSQFLSGRNLGSPLADTRECTNLTGTTSPNQTFKAEQYLAEVCTCCRPRVIWDFAWVRERGIGRKAPVSTKDLSKGQTRLDACELKG